MLLDVIKIIYDVNSDFSAPWLSEGVLFGDYLYLGSWYNQFLGRIHIKDLNG